MNKRKFNNSGNSLNIKQEVMDTTDMDGGDRDASLANTTINSERQTPSIIQSIRQPQTKPSFSPAANFRARMSLIKKEPLPAETSSSGGEESSAEQQIVMRSPVEPQSSASGQNAGRVVPHRPSQSLLDVCAGGAIKIEDDAAKQRLKQAEKRAGVTLSIMEEFFKIGGDVHAKIAEEAAKDGKPKKTLQPTYWEQRRSESNMFVAVEEEMDQKKFKGKQYADSIVDEEKKRIIDHQKRQQKSGTGRSHATINMSNLSITTKSTDLESVGTCLPNVIPETIMEDDQIESVIRNYFGPNKPRRPNLPICDIESKILDAIKANRVVIIEGATGCGKTTQVPQFIADECARTGQPFNIVVTQPRRIAARSIAGRVAEERNWEIGTVVGYQIGLDKMHKSQDTRILYCTTGVLLEKLIHKQKLEEYTHIIIDEVHERSIDTDLVLLVVKKLMTAGGGAVKIILMSATFDTKQLMEYFSIPIVHYGSDEIEMITEVKPKHVEIAERAKKVNIYYYDQVLKSLADNRSKYPEEKQFKDLFNQTMVPFEMDSPYIYPEAMEIAARIIEVGLDALEAPNSTKRGAVLVFLPGYEEIKDMMHRLAKYPELAKIGQWKIHQLHSSIPLDKQKDIFLKPLGRERKIILATNIAESSITVSDVEYVIDFCLTKNLTCDLDTHITVLRMEWAAKSNCDQRAGRAGRVQDGRVYRLLPKVFYDRLQEYSPPDILRCPLESSILRVKNLGMGPPKKLLALAMDPPDLSDIYQAVLQLKQIGALSVLLEGKTYDEEDGDMTTLGAIMSYLPIDVRLAKLVVLGHVFDVLEDCITIAACLSTQGIFRREFEENLKAYKSRLAWSDRSFSDGIAYLNAYKMYKSFEDTFSGDKGLAEKWCKQNYLQYKRLLETTYVIDEVTRRLSNQNINPTNRPNTVRNRHEEELILKVAMCGAFYPFYFLRNEIDREGVARMIASKDPYDTVAITGLPQNQGVLYAHKIKQIFSTCSKMVDISFEDTKAYLTFLDEKNPLKEARDLQVFTETKGRSTPFNPKNATESAYKDMAIKTAVYVAIAMKANRNIPPITAYTKRVADTRLERIIKLKNVEIDRMKTLTTSRISVPMVMSRVKIDRLKLPAMDCSKAPIIVTYVIDPGNFYAQYRGEITDEKMNELSAIISYETDSVPCDHTIKLGDMVIAPFLDEHNSKQFGRAKVIHVERPTTSNEVEYVEVSFLDYGYVETFYKLRELSQIGPRANLKLTTIAPQAFRCQLAQVNPSPVRCFDNCWDVKSIKHFKKLVMGGNKKIVAHIYSVVNRVVRVELYDEGPDSAKRDTIRDSKMSINDDLINQGYAEQWEESIQSRLNHEQRRRAQLARPANRNPFQLEGDSQSGTYNSDDIIEIEVDDKDPPVTGSNTQSHDKIYIRGPFSPLESSFTGITKQTRNRTVRIERDSVNCVVLEPDYLSKHSRLIVASSVGLGHTTGNINLRNTTLMPNIRGFPALMALLFAPRIEFRLDKEGTQYVGALCGLGYHSTTKKGYDAESDAEIIFDTDITREDVAKVNIIRYHFSDLLKSRQQLQEYAQGSLSIKQHKVRGYILRLLDRRRRLSDYSSEYHPSYKWGLVDDSYSVTDATTQELTRNCILPIINPLKMRDYDWYDDVKTNMAQLKEVQQGSISMAMKCKLCKVTSFTIQDLTFHLSSDQHMDAVNDFNKMLKIYEQQKLVEEHRRQLDELNEEDPNFDYFEDETTFADQSY